MSVVTRKLSHLSVAALTHSLAYFARTLDDEEADACGAALGRTVQRLLSSRSRIAYENLRLAFVDEDESFLQDTTRRVFENIGRTLFEFARFPLLSSEKLRSIVTLENVEHISRVSSAGKGGLLISPHFGNWEMFGSWLPANGFPVTFLTGKQSNPYVDAQLNSFRRSMGVGIIPVGKSITGVIRCLKRGGIVATIPDQHSAIGYVPVSFFGRTVAAHRGPAALAYRTGAAILPGFLVRQGPACHRGWIEAPLYPDQSRPESEEISRLTQGFMTLFEKAIRRYPDQWMWTHRRWKAPSALESKSEVL